MTDITVTMTQDEVQFLLNSMDTHIKAQGLAAATAGAIILAKLQTATNGQVGANSQGADGPAPGESEGDQEHEPAG